VVALDNLHKRNIIVMDWCVMCKENEKSADHLLIGRLLVPCGMFSLNVLGCLGLCQDKLLTYLLVGGLLTALRVPLFGR